MTHTHTSTPAAARRHSLRAITAGIVGVSADLEVSDVTLDSRAACPGSLFLACRGKTHHGIRFAPQAVSQGAKAVLYDPADLRHQEMPDLGSDIFLAPVADLGRHVGTIADRFFGEPAQALTVVGITGTNGKTTCAWLLAQALKNCGRSAAYIGTIGYGIPPARTATNHTTSDAVSVHRQLAELRTAGVECVSMEVTSHAIDQDRVAAVRFETAVLTNLTRDHLDYHGTMEAYGATKARLFAWPSLAHRVINIDDSFGARLAAQAQPSQLIVTGRSARANQVPGAQFVRAARAEPVSSGLQLAIESSWGDSPVTVPLIGEFNIDNVLTVLGVLLAWGIELPLALQAVSRSKAPPGRMEVFGGAGSEPTVIVDYAHTPDALDKALRASRAHCRGKLRAVFGCGGDRDTGKRSVMGRIAVDLADDVIVTDDNPRTEDPANIVRDILEGMRERRGDRATADGVEVEHDRAKAIRAAIQRSASDDVVVIAGKGHEDYQIYGTERRPFQDQSIVQDELARKGGA
jgi:UDP-N-acetylmuramoyl-L-alanyl-D-glutamate--2,6-diaminopimelate ligase